MKLYLFIARQFLASNKGVGKFTGIISKAGIAIGTLALIIAVSVLNGFEEQLNKKIGNFDGFEVFSNGWKCADMVEICVNIPRTIVISTTILWLIPY